jgi:hypothetical protein
MAGLEFLSESELQECAYARLLLTSLQKKVGKTVSVLTTAPGPIVVLNCDGPDAAQAAVRFGAKGLKVLHVNSPEVWEKGCKAARDMANADQPQCRTIVVDTVTLLINVVIANAMAHRCNDSFDIWKRTYASFMDGLTFLNEANAHVILIAHGNVEDGQLPLDGKLKSVLPGLVNDIVSLDYKPGRTVKNADGETMKLERAYMVGPTATGLSGGRHSDENKLIEANVMTLLKELRITP